MRVSTAVAVGWVWVSLGCATTPVPAPAAPASAQPSEGPTEGHHADGHDWNSVYQRGSGFNPKANALLASAIEGRTPGAALDVGMGQGRNAVFLATRGWAVTGVDTAEEGLKVARANADAAHVKVNAVLDDVEHFDMGQARYDLVALMYVGGAELSERIKTALKPGGLVVVEYFHKDMEAGFHHSMGAFETGELERLFAGYTVVKSEVVEDVADFGQQKAKLVRFVAQKPSR